MDLIVPNAMHAERDEQPMSYEWFVGIDWGSQQHQVCVLDRDRHVVGERVVSAYPKLILYLSPKSLITPSTY